MTRRAALVAALALTSALLLTAQTRPPSIPLQAGDIAIRGGLIFDSVRDDAVANTGIVVRGSITVKTLDRCEGRIPTRHVPVGPCHGPFRQVQLDVKPLRTL